MAVSIHLVFGDCESGMEQAYGNEDFGSLNVEDHDFGGRTGMSPNPLSFFSSFAISWDTRLET